MEYSNPLLLPRVLNYTWCRLQDVVKVEGVYVGQLNSYTWCAVEKIRRPLQDGLKLYETAYVAILALKTGY